MNNKDYMITLEKPEDVSITIANSYQIFWRHVANPKIWTKLNEQNYYKEYKHDTEKLDKIKVLSIEEDKPKEEKLFNI